MQDINKYEEMQAIILAAGMGTRLKHLTRDVPKPMVSIDGKPMISYIVETLFKIKRIQEIIIVTGFKHEILEEYINNSFKNNIHKIRLIYNNEYQKGSIITLKKVASFIDKRFILLNIDHIFPLKLILKIINEVHPITIGCDHDRKLTDDDMKVLLKDGKMINISKKLTEFNAGYIGLTVVDKELISDYFSCADLTLQKEGDHAVVEQILLELSKMGINPRVCDLSGFGWFEIDTLEDYRIAEKGLKEWK